MVIFVDIFCLNLRLRLGLSDYILGNCDLDFQTDGPVSYSLLNCGPV